MRQGGGGGRGGVDVAGAWRALEDMRAGGVEPDAATHELLVDVCARAATGGCDPDAAGVSNALSALRRYVGDAAVPAAAAAAEVTPAEGVAVAAGTAATGNAVLTAASASGSGSGTAGSSSTGGTAGTGTGTGTGRTRQPNLTEAEKETIVRCRAMGHTFAQIGLQVGRSPGTVAGVWYRHNNNAT